MKSAFAGSSHPYFIKSAKDETNAEGSAEIAYHWQTTSMRQAAEQGMRVLQASFAMMIDRFYTSAVERERLWLLQLFFFSILEQD